ncbi:MAG: FtsW/RodA/SpoVE family cell cycle protein, partial [Paracoccaceae bacterium]
MSYLEYRVRTVPVGFRKVLFLNWPLILLITAVAIIGFVMLYSVAGGNLSKWAQPQMWRFLVGMVLMFIIAMVPIWFWRNMAGLAFALSLLLLLLVEFFGVIGMGAQRWIDLGFIRLQPSEVAKITLVMLLAAYYDWLPTEKLSRPFWVLIPLLMILMPTYLVLRQPDLGTAILLSAGGGIMMFLAGVHWLYFAAVVVAGGGLVYAVLASRDTTWQMLSNYQYTRIDTFLDPSR